MISEEKIKKALSRVNDPDLGKDLVSLNMVGNIAVNGHEINLEIVLTTPACPLKEKIRKDIENAIAEELDEPASVLINFTSDVTSKRNSQLNILPSVKNIICVASGKGGVGKSTVSVNLAYALAKSGASVGLIDADIHGPSIPQMLGIKGQRPDVREIKEKHFIVPLDVNGVKVLSIGLLVDDRQAVVWRGPMVTSALRQFITDTIWGKLDYLILDLPPGTGDVHLTLAQTVPITGAIVVTTPQEVALLDAKKAIAMFRLEQINVPMIGIIENMSYFTPPELPEKRYYLFGKGGGRALAETYEIPFLGEVPIIEAIRQAGDEGVPAVLNESHPDIQQVYQSIASMAAQSISLRNANLEPTKIVEITRY